jgi:hypothetical protein
MLIHSNPGVEHPRLTSELMKNIVVNDDNGDPVNPSGIEVAVTSSGSMTRALFPRWCKHFVKNLPEGQGKGRDPVILFLDGHASRWSYTGLEYLYDNNVITICLPSHTSVWSQPNDAAQNAAFKAVFGEIVRNWRNGTGSGFSAHLEVKMLRADFNEIFVEAHAEHIRRQHSRLEREGTNAVKSGWNNVGLGENPTRFCPFWNAAIESLGLTSELETGGDGRAEPAPTVRKQGYNPAHLTSGCDVFHDALYLDAVLPRARPAEALISRGLDADDRPTLW